MKLNLTTKNSLFGLILFFIGACSSETSETVIPKKIGNLRVSHQFLPKDYSQHLDMCGFTLTLPDYAKLTLDKEQDTFCYCTIEIPQHKAKIHLAKAQMYDSLDLRKNLSLTERQTERHITMADDVNDTLFLNSKNKVYGRVQLLTGNVAEPILFIATDSSDNFLFGRLIFDARPNYDSILPAINYVKADIFHLIENLQWTEK